MTTCRSRQASGSRQRRLVFQAMLRRFARSEAGQAYRARAGAGRGGAAVTDRCGPGAPPAGEGPGPRSSRVGKGASGGSRQGLGRPDLWGARAHCLVLLLR